LKLWQCLFSSLFLMILFQNCTQGDGYRSQAYVVKDVEAGSIVADAETADNLGGISSGGLGVGGTLVLSKDPLSCFQNYITIFEWKNPSANLMVERPVLGTIKIGTLKLNSNGFTSPIDAGWAIEGSIDIKSNGSSSTSIRVLKEVPNSGDSLDCYFMSVASNDTKTLEDGLGNVFLPNVGGEPSSNIFVGFIRYQEQFIACRVTESKKNIELKNTGESSLFLTFDHAFIIKRGCYDNQGQN
jgi:hypothetical protein